MGNLSKVLESISKILPVDAQTALLSKLKISDGLKSSPAGAILMGMYLLEYTGFPRYIDELLGEKHRTISEMIADDGDIEFLMDRIYPTPYVSRFSKQIHLFPTSVKLLTKITFIFLVFLRLTFSFNLQSSN